MRLILASLAGLALLASPMIASAQPAPVARPTAVKATSLKARHHHRVMKKSAGRHAKKGFGRHAMRMHKGLRVARVTPHK